MTAPGYRPPDFTGWWVKRDRRVYPGAAQLIFTGSAPQLQAQVRPGGGTLTFTGSAPTITQAPAALHFSDNFTRADATTLGANWTARNGTNQWRITSNTARPTATTVQVVDSYNTSLASDNHKASITIGSTVPTNIYPYIRCNTAGEGVVAELSSTSGTTMSIYTISGWTLTGFVSRASASGVGFAAGNVISLEASGNTYILRKNGTSVLTWTDTGGAVWGSKVDSAHRLTAMGTFPNSTTMNVTNFAADDI